MSMETKVFDIFATFHPHEAAALDWPRFVDLYRRRTGSQETEEEIRAALAEEQS